MQCLGRPEEGIRYPESGADMSAGNWTQVLSRTTSAPTAEPSSRSMPVPTRLNPVFYFSDVNRPQQWPMTSFAKTGERLLSNPLGCVWPLCDFPPLSAVPYNSPGYLSIFYKLWLCFILAYPEILFLKWFWFLLFLVFLLFLFFNSTASRKAA